MLLVAAAEPAQAEFLDVLPLQDTAVTALTGVDDDLVAGHENGRVLRVAADDRSNVWSSRPASTRVAELTEAQGTIVVGYSNGVLTGLSAASGSLEWTRTYNSGISGLASDGTTVLVTTLDGTARRISIFDGATAHSASFEGALYGAHHADGWWVTGSSGTWRLDDALAPTVTSAQAGTDVVGLDGGAVVVDLDGALRRIDAAGLATASIDSDWEFTTVAADADHVVAGDAGARVHVLTHGLDPLFGPLATFALRAHDVILDPEPAVAFDGGWVGLLPLVEGPVVLMYAPQELGFVQGLAPVSFAYAHPAGEPGYFVSYAVQVRAPGAVQWQDATTGTLPADALTKLHTAQVDLGVFPSNTPIELRTVITDRMGRSISDGLAHPVRIDAEAPVTVGAPQLSFMQDGDERFLPSGEPVPSADPIVSVGHDDPASGVVAEWSEATIDGAPATILQSGYRFTRFTTDGLADGRHTWRLLVFDQAGNQGTFTGSFVTDTQAPGIVTAQAQGVGVEAITLEATTDETARCTASTSPGGAVASSPRGTSHAFFLDGLMAQTTYTLTLRCLDDAGREAVVQREATTHAGDPEAPRPDLSVSVTPAASSTGWHRDVPTLQASSGMDDASIHWSLDGSGFSTAVPALTEGNHTVVAFAVGPAGGVSDKQTLEVLVDLTPPTRPSLQWTEPIRSLRWDDATDAVSGVASYTVEGRRSPGGAWVDVGDVVPPGHRLDGISRDLVELRLTTHDHAGWSNVTEVISVGSVDETTKSLAFVETPTVAPGEDIAVRLRLAHDERFETAILVDGLGVHHPFSDRVRLQDDLYQIRAPADAFEPGEHRVRVRISDGAGQRDLDAGIVVLTTDDDAAGEDGGGDRSVARRDTPWPLWIGVAALAWALRRRTA